MYAPITVNYVPDGEDWTITVTDEDQTESATASGLIAARDQADQIVEKMVPSQTSRTVVHLLDGDAVAFTNTYLQARLGLTTPSTGAAPIAAPAEAATVPAAPAPIAAPAEPATVPAPISAPAEAATVPAAPAPTPAEQSPQQPSAPTAATQQPPQAETPSPTNPEQPTAPNKTPEMANVPAQGAEQVS